MGIKRTKLMGALAGAVVMGVIGGYAGRRAHHRNPQQLHELQPQVPANRKYPHGVGRRGPVDQGGDVTNFLRNNRIYRRAENHNGHLDRDNDRVACEKAWPL